ncbi:histidine phosphatase family protein [Microvirga tunisiensis]|uniref:Histidine phosphatase family protein n=1 Tax=Pannonibacter tanglangensis TaxID=2750084 RepID=A0A7X5F279_9HYPH|nr:histidine phosphatase family protein [Pannonibacter sp. XCT-53]NBN77154.1 histidine phosphatase family protein [Pannonibacter sp. XCT-53]
MPRLILYRHAKSDWSTPDLADHDRGLAPRGVDAALRLAAWLDQSGFRPDRVLCSTALRTRLTLQPLLPLLSSDCDIQLTREIYDLRDADYIELMRRKGGDARCLMLIGHNPAMHDTARELVIEGAAADLHALGEKFPTAGLAVIDLPCADFAGLVAQSGRLLHFIRPRDLV